MVRRPALLALSALLGCVGCHAGTLGNGEFGRNPLTKNTVTVRRPGSS